MHVEHLHRGEVLQGGAGSQAVGVLFEPCFQCHLQGIGEVAFEFVEGLFHFGLLQTKPPQTRRIKVSHIGA